MLRGAKRMIISVAESTYFAAVHESAMADCVEKVFCPSERV